MEATQSLINLCGKLFPEWITPLNPPVCQSMERCYICGCCEISLNTKEVWNLIREYTGRWDLLCVTNVEKLFKHKPLVIFITNTFTPLTDKTDQSPFCERAECKKTYMFQYQLKMQQWHTHTGEKSYVFHVIKPLEIGGT